MKQFQNINDTTIPLSQAIDLTTKWREVFMNTFTGSQSGDVFRGFVVPFESIEKLKERAEQFPELDINAVRTYICAKQNSPDPQDIILNVVLLPAHFDGEIYHDIWEYPDGGRAIYDFSQPCPPCCDVESPLHDNTKKG